MRMAIPVVKFRWDWLIISWGFGLCMYFFTSSFIIYVGTGVLIGIVVRMIEAG